MFLVELLLTKTYCRLGVIVYYLIESIPELLPSKIAESFNHLVVGLLLSALGYR